MYPNKVQGAPQNPRIGTLWLFNLLVRKIASITYPRVSSTAGTNRSLAISAGDAIRGCNWGPCPGTISHSIPIASGMTRMSEKIIPASREGYRRRGCRVTSAASAGVLHTWKKWFSARIARNSGKYRPACLIIHFGTWSTGSPLITFSKVSFFGRGSSLCGLAATSLEKANRCARKSLGSDAKIAAISIEGSTGHAETCASAAAARA
mmetsp:Transcript_22848/g.50117  ORF Transcript_22848/g.50117 Transcript_22848/m.50117 type:complete len:207 (-) Transcript_22848:283-903(-)